MFSSSAGTEALTRLPDAQKSSTKHHCSYADQLCAGCLMHPGHVRFTELSMSDCLHDFPPEMWEHCFDHLIYEHTDKLPGVRAHRYF